MKLKTDSGHVIEQRFGYLVINGQPYKEKSVRGQLTFEKVSKEKVAILEREADDISEKLKDSLDSKKILKEALMKLEEKELHTLFRNVTNKKRHLEPRTREHACVDMKIGNFILPIID